MKQVFRKLAAAALAGTMLAMPCAGAVSAEVMSTPQNLTKAEGDTSNDFTITSKDCGITLKDGQEYVLLVAKVSKETMAAGITAGKTIDVTIDENSLTFIDQKAASGDSVTFNFSPKSKTNSVILLGGVIDGKTSPVVIGYITSKGETITVSGKIAFVGSDGQDLTGITFSFTADKSDSVNVDASGSVDIPADATTIYISCPGYLTLTITNYSGGEISSEILNNFSKCAGDVDGDHFINPTDAGLVIRQVNKNPADFQKYDIDRNGVINPTDVGHLIRNIVDGNETAKTYDINQYK